MKLSTHLTLIPREGMVEIYFKFPFSLRVVALNYLSLGKTFFLATSVRDVAALQQHMENACETIRRKARILIVYDYP
jgi:hypothetical protein